MWTWWLYMEILNLIGFLKGSLVFSEWCPDSTYLFEEIQVLKRNLEILCYGHMSLCSSGNFRYVTRTALMWTRPEMKASQDILLLSNVALLPPFPLWSICGVLGSSSMCIFQPLSVLSEGWPPLLYEISVTCGVKIRNMHVFFCSWTFISNDAPFVVLECGCGGLQLCSRSWRLHHHPGGYCFWEVASLAIDQRKLRRSDLKEHSVALL